MSPSFSSRLFAVSLGPVSEAPKAEAIAREKEIAERIKEYICLFGPMKILLSDFGLEFNNELVDTMLKNIGAEHRATTSFNPRSNGLTEKLNSTLINALRKHTESNHQSWPAYPLE